MWARVVGDGLHSTGAAPVGDLASRLCHGPRFSAIREVWGLVGAKFLTDAAWFFYISWLPKYLYDARGFDVKQVGYYAWVPFAASGVGSLWAAGSRAGCIAAAARSTSRASSRSD